jgi:hypothetical protein
MDDSVVVLNLKNGFYYILNETSSKIWELFFVKKCSLPETVSEIAKLYDIEVETVQKDVDEEIEYWLNEKLIMKS